MQAKDKITGKNWAEHTKRSKTRKRARDEGAIEDGTAEDVDIGADLEMISNDDE